MLIPGIAIGVVLAGGVKQAQAQVATTVGTLFGWQMNDDQIKLVARISEAFEKAFATHTTPDERIRFFEIDANKKFKQLRCREYENHALNMRNAVNFCGEGIQLRKS